MSFRILVTGWRKWGCSDEMPIAEASRLLTLAFEENVPAGTPTNQVIVVHGNANGADRLSGTLALGRGYQVESYEASWWTNDRFDPRAGTIRNQRMVDFGAHVCIAFPGPGSRGTWDCIRRAKKADILVKCYGPFVRWSDDPTDESATDGSWEDMLIIT